MALILGCPNRGCHYTIRFCTFTNSHKKDCCPLCNTGLTLIEDKYPVFKEDKVRCFMTTEVGQDVIVIPLKLPKYKFG